jgi:hypothetical protein
MPNPAKDDDVPDRRVSRHYKSYEEDSGFDDCSGDNTSDGRVSPETCEELPARKKLSKRKAKPKISPADTGGRDADLVSADTPADLVTQVDLSAKLADVPVAFLPQADESAMSADTPTDLPTQVDLSAELADAPVACLPQADESTTSADTPEDVPAAPDEVTGTLEEATGMADTSGNMADFSDSMADTAANVAETLQETNKPALVCHCLLFMQVLRRRHG